MMTPVITKDMKLFAVKQPVPAGIKNVRSRAQSLDQFVELQNSGSQQGRVIPIKPRSSVSTGNIPQSGSLSRSPPKGGLVHRKTTLTAIQEGVEMGYGQQQKKRGASMKAGSSSKGTSAADQPGTSRGTASSSQSASDAQQEPEAKKVKKLSRRHTVFRWFVALTAPIRFSRNKDSEVRSTNSS